MKIKKVIILVITVTISMAATGWSQENNEIKISNKPIEIELADEAAVVIGQYTTWTGRTI